MCAHLFRKRHVALFSLLCIMCVTNADSQTRTVAAHRPIDHRVYNLNDVERPRIERAFIDSIRASSPISAGMLAPSEKAPFPLLEWPCAWTLYTGLNLVNYVDDDPSPAIVDYMGNPHSYDGHYGTDFGPIGFHGQDKGIPILAAADGVVMEIQYSRESDRNIGPPYPDGGNWVGVLHFDGTETWYLHLRHNSVVVEVGDTVWTGDMLGLMGSSGYSTDSHLHFELNEYIEGHYTFRDPWQGTYNTLPSLWVDQEPYVGDTLLFHDVDVFTDAQTYGNPGDIPWRLIKEELLHPPVYGADEPWIRLWTRFQGIAGDEYTVELRRPDNTVWGSYVVPLDSKVVGWHIWVWGWGPSWVFPSDYGTWTAQIVVDGEPVLQNHFEVGATTIYAPRFWPVAGKSFRIGEEIQYDTLRISELGGPAVYTLVDAPTFVSLVEDSIVRIGGDVAKANKQYNFTALAEDVAGHTDTMYYQLVMNVGTLWMTDNGFSDAVTGDGDGIFESGETVQLTLELSNYDENEITDVAVSLSVDDGSLYITNDYVYIGTIAGQSSVSNGGTPFEFDIPPDYIPRNDSFFFDISWNGGQQQMTRAVEQAIGEISLLLVDDDDGDDIERFYRQSLGLMRIPCHTWSTALSSAPDSSDLNHYDVVFWFTGDYRSDPLDADEIAAMTGYLDGQGNLFLTGQGIAAQLNMEALDFLNSYLKSEYLLTQYIPVLAPEIDCQVFRASDSMVIQGSGGASNQTNPDLLAALDGGVGELNYLGRWELGGISYAGDYKTVFFSFGCEAVRFFKLGWADREITISRILDFFGYAKPGCPLTIEFAEPSMHISDHTPEIGWVHCDTEPYVQTMYHIQVGDDDDWASAEMWDHGPVSGPATSVDYAGSALLDGAVYYSRVRTSDVGGWSNWYYERFRMNTKPSQPVDLAPAENAEVTDLCPDLSHANAGDSEGDICAYSYDVFGDEAMTQLIETATGCLEAPGPITTYCMTTTLTYGEDYFWRVRACDGYEDGDWSELASFLVVQPYICGNANGDDLVDVGDAVYLINYVFKGGPPPDPIDAGNVNCDSLVDVGDAVYLINYVFKGGPTPECECAER